jgi:hypothetical protein
MYWQAAMELRDHSAVGRALNQTFFAAAELTAD